MFFGLILVDHITNPYISFRLKVMLRMWGEELNARDEEVKSTVKGKAEANRYTQTR